MTIDETSFRKILTRFRVFPPFIDIVQAFGQRAAIEDESYSGFHFRDENSPPCHGTPINFVVCIESHQVEEQAYIVKYVEEHGRLESSEKWSLRQIGVYHRSTQKCDREILIAVNPGASLQRRFNQLSSSSTIPSFLDLTGMIISSAVQNWRFYISDIEGRCMQMVWTV